MQKKLAVVWMIGLSAACSEFDVKKIESNADGSDDGLDPIIEVSPEFIEFPTIDVVAGDPAASEEVTVRNIGSDSLHIEDLYLSSGSPSYSFSPISSYLIEPGAEAKFTITFDPNQPYEHVEAVLVDSDDPVNPTVGVDVLGNALAPAIEVDPMELDFGFVDVGCQTIKDVFIRNVGNAPMTLDDMPRFTQSSADLQVHMGEDYVGDPGNVHVFPLEIAPGEQIKVQVLYEPFDENDDTATLTVSSNDPVQPQTIANQYGGINGAEEQEDLFEQPTQPMTDVVFVVDNSCSMGEEQAALADNFENFIFGLSLTEADYQIAVITTDSASFRGEVINNDTLNPISKFTTQAVAGTSGSGFERGLQMSYECVQTGNDCSYESGFMRDDAMLSMVYVSDEPDQSTLDASSYVSYFWTLKDDPDMVKLHAVAGDTPSSSCSSASPGYNYDTAVELTDGFFLSICASDWGSHMTVLAEGSVSDLSSFKLSDDPVEDTIEVFVDDERISSGWWYTGHEEDKGTNAVRFQDEYIPEGGAEIRIEYVIRGDCDQ